MKLWDEPVCEARAYSQAIEARERAEELEGSRDEWEAACKHYVARVAELEGALRASGMTIMNLTLEEIDAFERWLDEYPGDPFKQAEICAAARAWVELCLSGLTQ